MLPMLSYETMNIRIGNPSDANALTDKKRYLPHRSRSSITVELVNRPGKTPRRRSVSAIPLHTMAKNEAEPNTKDIPVVSLHTVPSSAPPPPPPPLCRWSSCPPQDEKREGVYKLKKYSSAPTMPLRSLCSSRPPRLPTRKSCEAAQLRSALPPRVPQRKPGVTTVDATALPPFKPRRCSMDDSSDDLSIISGITMDSLSDEDDDDDSSSSSESTYDNDDVVPSCFGSQSTGTSGGERPDVRTNLRNVLVDVLDSLDYFDEDF